MARMEFAASYGRLLKDSAPPTSESGLRFEMEKSKSSLGGDLRRSDCAVYVSGLGPTVTVEDLTALFAPVGGITNVKLNKDFTTGQRKDDGYIYFADEQSAVLAVRLFDGMSVDGKITHVSRSNMKHNKVVVIGATVTGLCAAVAAERAGASVVVLSMKQEAEDLKMYSYMINLIGTPLQEELGIKDSIKSYITDMRQAYTAENTRVIEVLAREADSPELWSFLTEDLGVTFNSVHCATSGTVPRSHGTAKGDLAKEVRQGLEDYIMESSAIRMVDVTSVSELLAEDGRVTGVHYSMARPSGGTLDLRLTADAVVVATGGFVSSDKLLQKYCGDDVARLPRCYGDVGSDLGIQLLEKMGALLTHMDKVAIHPTAFVDPTDPEAKYKQIAPAIFRSHGGLLIGADGKRFVDETQKDSVAAAIREKNMHLSSDATLPCAFLVLNRAAAYPCEGLLKMILSEGLMVEYNGIDDLCLAMGIDKDELTQTFLDVSKSARGLQADPFGRASMPNNYSPYDILYVGLVTPALEYTMGGIVTNQYTQVMREQSMTPYPGLFAVGEITASVESAGRLIGNALLETVAFGRIAGELAANHQPALPALSPKAFVPLKLASVLSLSPSTKLFRFSLPTPHHQAGLELGQYVAMRKVIDGKEMVRYYSPISRADDLGHLDVLIKTQTGGDLTGYLHTMKPGETIDFKGPISGLEMVIGSKKRVGMLAGGTGISPMLQLIRAHLLHETKTGHNGEFDLSLVYAVKNEEELLLKDRLEQHKANHPHLRLYYVLAEPPEEWSMGKGFVTPDIIKEHMPPPSDDALVVVCGPPVFCKVMVQHLEGLGYVKGRHYYSYM